MSSPAPPSPRDLLMPDGKPLETAGAGRHVREVQDGPSAADEMFDGLTVGGAPHTPVGYPGVGYKLPGGGWVGLRRTSKSGPPTIDLDIPGIPIKKIKFT